MGQADPSLGDGTLAPYPGLAATLAHGMDFFDRPSGVVIPQFASSLSASLGGQSSDGAQTSQASADQGDAAPPPITSSRDYDRFSDPLARSPPAANAYDQFSDAVASGPRSVGGPFSDAVANSQVGPAASSYPSQTAAGESAAQNAGGSSFEAVANSPAGSGPYDQFSDAVANNAPRSFGGLFSDAVASSEVGRSTSDDPSGAAASDGAPQSVGGLFSDAVAGSQVTPGTQSDPVWDPFGEVAASAPVGRAIGSFADKVLPNGAIATLRPVVKGFGDYLSNSVDALAKGARDIPGYARDLVDNPVEFLRQAGPTFTGLGFSIPAVGVGPITGASALRGGSAAAEEISALAAPSEALLSRGITTAQDAGGLANEGRLAADATQGTATEAGSTDALSAASQSGQAGAATAEETGTSAAANSIGTADTGTANNAASNGRLTKAEQLAVNRAKGAAAEQRVGEQLQQTDLKFARQVTLETRSGARARLDYVTMDPKTGELGCIECKGSATAPLSEAQRLVFFELEHSGGKVVGAGKPRFPGGMQFPPTKVKIIREP